MGASPDVEADLLSEGSPLRSPSPEAGVGDDVPAEPQMPEAGDDSESEDDDRRRVKRDRDEPEPGPDAAKRQTPGAGPGGSGGRGRGRGDQPHGGRGANPPAAGTASGRGGSAPPAGRGGRGGRGPSPPFQRAPSRDRFANGHGADGAHAPYHGHVEVTRVFPAPPNDRRSGPGREVHGVGSEPSFRGGPLGSARNAPHALPSEYPRGMSQQNPKMLGSGHSGHSGHAGHAGHSGHSGQGPQGPQGPVSSFVSVSKSRFPDRNAPATLDDALAIFATRADLTRLCVADERGPAPPNADALRIASLPSYAPRVAVEALHAARGAIVRVGSAKHGHAGGAWEIAELAGGVVGSSSAPSMALPVLRLFDRSGRVAERATELGECSNSVPSLREWDAYVENCAAAAAAGAGPPPPRVGDVEAVRDALDWTFRRDNGGAGRAYDLPPPRAGNYGPPPFGFSAGESRGGSSYQNVASRDHHGYPHAGDGGAAERVGQKRRPSSPVAAYDRAPEGAPSARRRVEGDVVTRDRDPQSVGHHCSLSSAPRVGAAASAPLDRDPNESTWIMDTRGNNGLVVGVRGENVKKVERETGARVHCEKDKATVLLSGAPAAVAHARRLVEATLRQAGIDFGGSFGGGAPIPGDDRARDDERRPGTSPGTDHGISRDGEDLRARLTKNAGAEKRDGKSSSGDGDAAKTTTRADPRDAEAKATIVAEPSLVESRKDGTSEPSSSAFVAVVDCGGPKGLSLVVDGKKGSEGAVALFRESAPKCAFEIDDVSRRVTIRAPDSASCAVAAEIVAEIANREFTGMVTQRNLSNRFEAGLKAAELLRAVEAEGGDDDDAKKGCDVLIDVGKDLGAVIGSKGATIVRLQKASACVMTTDNKAKTVRVVGATPEITKKGEEMIREAIAKAAASAATRGPGRGRGRGAGGGRGRGRGRG